MLSLQYTNRYNQLMAADECYLGLKSKSKSAYKCVKSSNVRNVEPISIDKMLSYDIAVDQKRNTESADEDDEISVGCPSPVAIKSEDEKEPDADKYSEKESRLRSSSCSSESSSPFRNCRQSSDSFGYRCGDEAVIKSENRGSSDPEIGTRRYAFSDDDDEDEDEDDEIMPAKEGVEEYFKPLKRLKMMKIDKTSFSISERSKSNLNKRLNRHNNSHKVSNIISSTDENADEKYNANSGVKSFSICDILSHKPNKSPASSSKIVRPWDSETHEESANPYLLPPPAHRGILSQHPMFISQFNHQQITVHLHRPKSEDVSSAYESCSSSGRSSTGGSDCCTSPDVLNCSMQNASISNNRHHSHRSRNLEQSVRSKSANGKSTNSSPLDALFQMTNKTFDELNGDPNENGNHLNIFNNRQQAKKKRKSRTAFTNTQIFELEKRFLYQKYLSPADRDEIAAQLGLSNAQVITWFQNRRAKLKRDMEEQKKDLDATKILSVPSTFLESVHNLGILKKKPISHSECKH